MWVHSMCKHHVSKWQSKSISCCCSTSYSIYNFSQTLQQIKQNCKLHLSGANCKHKATFVCEAQRAPPKGVHPGPPRNKPWISLGSQKGEAGNQRPARSLKNAFTSNPPELKGTERHPLIWWVVARSFSATAGSGVCVI